MAGRKSNWRSGWACMVSETACQRTDRNVAQFWDGVVAILQVDIDLVVVLVRVAVPTIAAQAEAANDQATPKERPPSRGKPRCR